MLVSSHGWILNWTNAERLLDSSWGLHLLQGLSYMLPTAVERRDACPDLPVSLLSGPVWREFPMETLAQQEKRGEGRDVSTSHVNVNVKAKWVVLWRLETTNGQALKMLLGGRGQELSKKQESSMRDSCWQNSSWYFSRNSLTVGRRSWGGWLVLTGCKPPAPNFIYLSFDCVEQNNCLRQWLSVVLPHVPAGMSHQYSLSSCTSSVRRNVTLFPVEKWEKPPWPFRPACPQSLSGVD